MENWDAYQKARKRAEGKLAFFVQLAAYLTTLIVLIIFNLGSSDQNGWCLLAFAGWGLVMLVQGLRVFVFHDQSFVTEKMIERQLRKQGEPGNES